MHFWPLLVAVKSYAPLPFVTPTAAPTHTFGVTILKNWVSRFLRLPIQYWEPEGRQQFLLCDNLMNMPTYSFNWFPFSNLSPSSLQPHYSQVGTFSSRKANCLKALLMSQEVWTGLSGRGYEYSMSITVSFFMNIRYLLLEPGPLHATSPCCFMVQSCQIVEDLPASLSFSPPPSPILWFLSWKSN